MRPFLRPSLHGREDLRFEWERILVDEERRRVARGYGAAAVAAEGRTAAAAGAGSVAAVAVVGEEGWGGNGEEEGTAIDGGVEEGRDLVEVDRGEEEEGKRFAEEVHDRTSRLRRVHVRRRGREERR